VGQGDARHDWACEVAAPRYYEILRRDPEQPREVLVELLSLGRAGSMARGKLDLLAWPTLEAAKLLAETGALPAALAHIEETRAALPPDHPHQLPLLRRMALLSSERGRFKEALGILDEVDRTIGLGHAEPYARYPNQRDRAAILLRMGLVDLAAREIGQARRGLEQAHEDGLSVVGPLVNVYCTLIHIYLAQSRFDEVIDESDSLLSKHATLFEARPGGRATMLFNTALAHELMGYTDGAQLGPARERFEGVLAIPEASQEQRSRSRIGLARLDTRSGKPDNALARLEAVRESEGLSTMISAELETAAARAAIAIGEPRARLRIRRESLAEALRSVYDEITAEAPRTGGIGFLGFRAYRVILATLIDLHVLVDDETGPQAVLNSLFEGQQLDSLTRFVGADQYVVEDVQAHLVPPRGGVLVFFPSEEGSHLLAIDATRVVHGRTQGIIEIRDACAPFVAQLRRSPGGLEPAELDRRKSDLDARSTVLFEILVPDAIRPVLAEWEEVVFIGSDYLRGLPIECLSPRGDRPLGLSKAVSHVPSLPLGIHLSREARGQEHSSPPLDLILVGDPIRGDAARSKYGEQVDFQMTPAELEQLSAPFEPARFQCLLGARATLQGLEDLAPHGTRLLHLVTHGIRDDAREASRGLLLSSTEQHDGLLFGPDVELLPASEFVILSSCASAQGPWRGGDEKSATLVGAFMRAGALGVLSTPSEVELTPTLRLGATFQDEVAHGVTPAEGLRRARQELVSAGFDDPYYYGLPQITGLGHEALFPPRERTSGSGPVAYLIVAVGLALLAAGLIHSRSRRREV